jgi:hypothetical protein
MNKNIQKLIADVSMQCVENKINFRLEYKSQVDEENMPCSGYFDENSLVVATKKKKMEDWLDVLVHESCHLDQFLAGSKVWTPDSDALNIVEDWIHGKNIKNKKLIKGFRNAIALELDCEKRSIKKIKKYKLPIDSKKYIQKANAYLFSYLYAYVKKAWYPKPYENPKIYLNMPKEFLSLDEYFTLSTPYFKYFS